MSKMKSRIPSPARSQPAATPRRLRDRSSRSLGSPTRSKPVRLSTLVQQFKDAQTESSVLSPVNRMSMLSDNTDIDEPRRQSWWKKLDDDSRDVMEYLPSYRPSDNANDVEEMFEVLSQEPKYDLSNIPDSSDSESISSIVVPQRKLFSQKENKPRKPIGNIIGSRDTLTKLQKSRVEAEEKTVIASPKKLFRQASQRSKPLFPPALLDISTTTTITDDERNETIKTVPKKLFGERDIQKPKSKYPDAISTSPRKTTGSEPESAGTKKLFTQNQPRSKPAFPSALLELSQDKTGTNKTTEMAPPEVKARNLFGKRPGPTRKNIFANFVCSESEDEISEIHHNTVGFQKRRGSSVSRGFRDGSPSYSITTELDDWKMQPSSTMMVDNLDEIPGNTPMKRLKLSKLDEQDTGSSSTANKTNQSERSVPKNKSKISHNTSKDKNIEQVYEKLNSPILTKNKSIVKNLTQNMEEGDKDKDITIQQTKNKISRKSIKESIDNDGNIALEYDDDDQVDQHEIVDTNEIPKDQFIEQTEVEVERNEQEVEKLVLQEDEEMVQSVLHDEEADEEEDNAEEHEQTMVVEEQEKENEEEENEPSVLQDEEDDEMGEPAIEKGEVESGQEDEVANDEDEVIEEDHETSAEQVDVVESECETNEEPLEQTMVETDNENQNEAELSIEQDQSGDSKNVESEAEDENDDVEENDEEKNDEEIILYYEEDEGNNESVEASIEQDDEVEQEQDDHEEVECERQNDEEGDENQESDQPEDIQETPDSTMDTTDRKRKKPANETEVRSPEAILHDKTNWRDTFPAQGRNTSARNTKSVIQTDIRSSLVPMRDSLGSNTDSSAQGSGWDSHRVTRKTMRQTLGKDFTPRKSLRAMVMEKSAKRQSFANKVHESIKIPQANSTEAVNDISDNDNVYDATASNVTDRDTNERDAQSDLDTSSETESNLLEFMQKMKLDAIERQKQIAETVRQIREQPRALPNKYDYFSLPKTPRSHKGAKPIAKAKPKARSAVPLGEMPKELLEDMKYKPPKRFAPRNASWVTKRLYKFLEQKLEPKYDYRARVRAEKLVEHLYHFSQNSRRLTVASAEDIARLKHEMAKLRVVKTHFDFYQFFHDYMPREVRIKVNPDVVNNLPLPAGGVYSNILHKDSSR